MSQAEIIDNKTLEQKRIDLDYENVWKQLANMEWRELKSACRFAYDAGRGAMAAQIKREKETE